MRQKLIALAAATAVAVSGFSASSAEAGNRDLSRALIAAGIMIAIAGAASAGQTRGRAHAEPPHHGPDRGRDVHRHRDHGHFHRDERHARRNGDWGWHRHDRREHYFHSHRNCSPRELRRHLRTGAPCGL